MLPTEVIIVTSHKLNDVGGVECFVASLSSWCCKKGMKVTILSRRLSLLPLKITNGPISMQKEQKTIYVKKLALPYLVYYLCLCLFSLSAFLALLKAIRASMLRGNKSIILHSQDMNFAAIATVFAGNVFGIPTVIHQHGPYIDLLHTKSAKILEQFINRLVCNLSNIVIVTDRNTKNYLLNITDHKEKICII